MGGTYSLATAANAPVAIGCNVTVPAEKDMVAKVTAVDIDCGSFDPDGDAVTLSLDPSGPYPIGDTKVTLTATDPSGQTDSTTAVITVRSTAYSNKEEAIMILNGLVDPDDDNQDNPIQLAVNALVAGLNNGLCWAGPDRIAFARDGVDGTGAFTCSKTAIGLLDATDPYQAAAIDLIVAADKICCDTAIADATFHGSNVTEAKRLRNEGNVANKLGFSDVAAAKYAEAWTKANEGPNAPTGGAVEVPTPEVGGLHAPDVSTYSPRQITSTSAVLWGCLIDNGGQPCECRFVYKKEGGAEEKTAWQKEVVDSDLVHASVTGLSPDTTYYYTMEAKNQTGEVCQEYCTRGTFKTLP